MTASSLPILDSLSALADATRCRVLRLLDTHELTVGELCTVLQLPQSTVSRHLKTLGDAGWVTSRREGTSRFYSIVSDGSDGAQAQLWQLTREQLDGRPGIDQDARRLARVLARRSETSQQFFAGAAGQWDRLREELFGRDFAAQALIGLLPSHWVVGDLGCGTGVLLDMLAPHVARVIGIDASEEMLSAARERVTGRGNVDLRRGSLESLPLEAATLDAATMMLVLHHVASPQAAIADAARVLKPGGRLLVVDMLPHEREEYRRQMGHVWLGFAPDQIQRWMQQAGLTAVAASVLPPATEVKGPGLFMATGSKV
ncbi:MAG TPA: metalloregulator ArsR/SmtB family transcription factor [Vicinamibacterales bacterium]|nr:metalloregulator ArsR/SmtB family transcription factor [Vicinamibacterales bacterium]